MFHLVSSIDCLKASAQQLHVNVNESLTKPSLDTCTSQPANTGFYTPFGTFIQVRARTKGWPPQQGEDTIKQKCIGRESNPGLADISNPKILNGNGQFYH